MLLTDLLLDEQFFLSESFRWPRTRSILLSHLAARTWRRYTREVLWFVQSTPVHKRRYCAWRFLSRLTGPARLLAISWSRMAFGSSDGTRHLLQRLAASPLVRPALPNAAAICQQYFSFRRKPNESIASCSARRWRTRSSWRP